MRAEISCAVYFFPSMSIVQAVPMWRLTDRIVRSGLVIAWRLATSPTSTSPDFEKATTEGVVRLPSELGITTGSPASRNETTELVVPRSMPTALGMVGSPCVGMKVHRRSKSPTRIEVERWIGNFYDKAVEVPARTSPSLASALTLATPVQAARHAK